MQCEDTWAPDLFYDAPTRQYVILFSTTIPGRFPETDEGGDHNHRPYWITTQDFLSFSAPALAFDPGYNSIDGTLLSINGGLTLIYKDERPGHKRLHAVTASAFGKPWSPPTGPILERDWIEGPTVLNTGKMWLLYFDCYRAGHYGAAESQDGIHWTDITDKLKMPRGARHGTALAVTPDILDPLRKLKPVSSPSKQPAPQALRQPPGRSRLARAR